MHLRSPNKPEPKNDGTYKFKGALEQWAFKNFVPKMCSSSTIERQRVPHQWGPNLMSNWNHGAQWFLGRILMEVLAMAKAAPRPSSLGGLDDGQPHSMARLVAKVWQWLTLFPNQVCEGWAMATNFAPRPIMQGVSMMAELIPASGSRGGFGNGQIHSRA